MCLVVCFEPYKKQNVRYLTFQDFCHSMSLQCLWELKFVINTTLWIQEYLSLFVWFFHVSSCCLRVKDMNDSSYSSPSEVCLLVPWHYSGLGGDLDIDCCFKNGVFIWMNVDLTWKNRLFRRNVSLSIITYCFCQFLNLSEECGWYRVAGISWQTMIHKLEYMSVFRFQKSQPNVPDEGRVRSLEPETYWCHF